MIICPNCNHQNPDGAVQCEACYTPLPTLVACPSCGASVQANASFCGQCGADLRSASPESVSEKATVDVSNSRNPDSNPDSDIEIPDLLPPDPLIGMEPMAAEPEPEFTPSSLEPDSPAAEASPEAEPPAPSESPAPAIAATPGNATQLQVSQARLLHVQTDTTIELPRQLSVIRIGKANDRMPPDIDVSGFPNSEIVSRVHANLRVEGDVYYLEDIGSSNGTYVNNLPLPYGNRHRLRPGDRFSLGKEDKVSFIFQM